MYEQYLELVETLANEFNETMKLVTIGKSVKGVNITAVLFEKNSTNKAVLFTGLHHAREPASLMMNMYLILYMAYNSRFGDSSVKDLLNEVNLYFIPIINVDGFIRNNEIFNQTRNINNCMIRKNRRVGGSFDLCGNDEDLGVDLNRNYGYKFAYDDVGSSGYSCSDMYRGSKPFSEPEVASVRDFIESKGNIKVAFNYHAYGNIAIIPFNFLNEADSALIRNFTIQNRVYQDFMKEGHFPDGFTHGNGFATVQ